MEEARAIFSLLDCLVPTVPWPWQCITVLGLMCLKRHIIRLSISGLFQAILSIARKVANSIPAQGILPRRQGRLKNLIRLVADSWVGHSLAYFHSKVISPLLHLWTAFVLLAWIPVLLAGAWAVTIQTQAILPISRFFWRLELDGQNAEEEGSGDTRSGIQRPVSRWLHKYSSLARVLRHPVFLGVAEAVLCRIVLDGPAWIAMRLPGYEVLTASPEPNSPVASAPTMVLVGKVLLWLAVVWSARISYLYIHPDRTLVAIPFLLSWAAFWSPDIFHLDEMGAPAAFRPGMAWIGCAYYALLGSRVVYLTLDVAGVQRSLRAFWDDSAFRFMVGKRRPDIRREDLEACLLDDKTHGRFQLALSVFMSWQAMALLRMMEAGPVLHPPWLGWLMRVFGLAVRLVVFLSHASLAGWLG